MLTKENLFAFVSLKRHFRGDYSCATAHDFNVIPYSPLFDKRHLNGLKKYDKELLLCKGR